jgi:hypothetical protein
MEEHIPPDNMIIEIELGAEKNSGINVDNKYYFKNPRDMDVFVFKIIMQVS